MNTIRPFHVAVPVFDLQQAKTFYLNCFRCEIGREAESWVDLNFFGHQFVLHVRPMPEFEDDNQFNEVDGKAVPIPHYGVVLEWSQWEELAEHLKSINISFVIEPYVRFAGEVGEQATMFFLDPAGNALEFKAFKDESLLFAK